MALAATACGSNLPAPPSSTAERFYRAIEAGDGSAACNLLAPQTVQEVEQSERAPCRSVILGEDIPTAGEVTELQQYGTQAQVQLRGDTAFLAEFDDGWRIIAAACTARGDRPYDCKLTGG
ncbi:hypothetical protein E0H73_45100 [Kribbella pittospori]|uniref:Uncharacterized protein n=1 Tax=Kribbella pittospori TaxID=722689 RepID=A0A4R0JJ93_9ACTN|nr:hypothetical protein [Kribbella pittospori]TCC44866.1 hypothetical protein E0H73_45100 [Kribbella pittospori]